MGHLHYRAILEGDLNWSSRVQCLAIGSMQRVCTFHNLKVVFPSSESRSKGILDLIHSDVSGLMSVA